MKRSLHTRNRSILFLALALSLLLTPAAHAVQSTFKILMDFDPGAGSGCTVLTAAGPVPGVDRVEVVTVDTLGAGSAQVTQVQTQSCTAPPSTFSAPAAIAGVPPTPYTVGVGNGTGGLNVIEVAYPLTLSSNPTGTEVRVAVTGSDGGVLSDALIVTTPGGTQPIVITLLGLAEVPTLGELGLFALALVLAAAALVVLRRRRTATAFLVAFCLLGLSGLAYAAASDLNGNTTAEWGGALATDPTGPPDPPGADIGAFFGMKDAPSNRLYFRIDSTLLFNQAPVANDQSPNGSEDTALNLTLTGSDPDGDSLTFSIVDPPDHGTLGAFSNATATSVDVTYTPTPDYNGPDSFTFQVADGNGGTDDGTVTITLAGDDDAPTAVADAATVVEDSGANAVAVLANDTDVDGGPISISAVTQPANGTVVITGGGSGLTYAPNANYCNQPPGTTLDTFTYTLTPGSSSTTVTMTVTCADDAPVAVADAATVVEDSGATSVPVLANDTDLDGGPISVGAITQPANGTVVITGGGTGLTYAPNANYCNQPPGTTLDTFTYTLAPGSSSTTVTMTVTCVDDTPVAVADAATVAEDSGASAVPVLANDTDADAGPISIASVTQPANGAVVITGGGTGLTYAPNADYCNQPPGTTLDTFTYTLTPGNSSTTVTMTVTCVDDTPVAVADAATVGEDSGANAIPVLANDTDVDAGPKSVGSVTQPANGTVVITGGGSGLTYAPNANYCNQPPGTTLDTFTYTLTPGSSSTSVTMTVTCVDDNPVAVADSATVNEDSGASAVPVLANDTDLDGGPISIGAVTQPANGAVVITGGGTGLTYAPNANYCNQPPGTTLDTFTYSLTPGGSSTTVTMTVTCINDAPALDLDANDDQGTTGANFAVTFTEGEAAKLIEDPLDATVLDVDSANLASLTVTLTNLFDTGFETLSTDVTGTAIVANYVTVAGAPGTGTLTLTGPDTVANFQTVLRKVRYRNTDTDPNATARVINFVANDGTANSNTATSTVTVVPVDTPPTAVADSASVNEDSGAGAINVLANDTDPDNGPISIASVTQPANGTVVITGGGTGLTYAPNANYCNQPPGTTLDTFTYTLAPGGSSTTVTVTVTCVDDNPVAVADAATVTEDSGAAAIPVLANDTDADGGPISITSVTQPANGAVVITGGGTGLTYAPNANYCNQPPGTTLETFTYTLTPGGSSTTVTVTVTCVDDNPVAVADSATVVEDSGSTAIPVLTNDTDVDGGPKSVGSVTQPANGTVVITGGGTGLTYAPNANYCNTPPGTTLDTFTYTLAPGGSSTTVTMSVTCVNDPPVANPDTADINEEAPNVPAANTVSGNVLTNDTDPDGPPLVVSAVAGGSVGVARAGTYGSVTINSNGAYVYTLDDTLPAVNGLAPGQTLVDAFGYTASDGTLSSSSTLTVTIHGADDPATPDNDAFDFIGNVQLEVDRDTAATPEVLATTPVSPPTLGVLDGDIDPDGGPAITIASIVGCADLTAPFDCTIAGQGIVSLQADGSFSFIPEPGDTDPTATFQYTLTGNPNPATVTLTRFERVWFVDPNAGGGGNGTSASPFNVLTSLNGVGGAGDPDVAADYIFIHDGTLAGTLEMENNQHLIGEGVALTVPITGTFNGAVNPTVTLLPAGTRPDVTNAAGDTIRILNQIPIEIVGLSLASTTGNSIDLTSTAALTGSTTLTIGRNVFRGAGAEGVDLNLNAGTNGTLQVNTTNNSWDSAGAHTGNGFDARTVSATANLRLDFSNNTSVLSTGGGTSAVFLDGSGGGTLRVTGFANNTVHQNAAGNGVSVNTVTFDSDPATAGYQLVSGGAMVIGASGNGVGASGMVMSNASGDLSFADLDIFADGGTGLRVAGTGAVNTVAGTGMRFVVGAGVGIVTALGGPAVDLNGLTADTQWTTVTSTNTATTGVSLVNVSDGTTNSTFSAGSGSAITTTAGASGPAFNLNGGNALVTYAGTITNNGTAARAVSINGWSGDDTDDAVTLSGAIDENGAGIQVTGTGGTCSGDTDGCPITFSGGMDIDTTTGEGFSATTNGGSVRLHVTGTNTIDSVSATALRIATTTIGSSNLNFRSVASGNNSAAADPVSGIILSDTGALGGLVVTGTGAAGSGGTIQRTTGPGINLTNTANVNLSSMNVQNSADDGIRGAGVAGFVMTGGSVSTNGDAAGESGMDFANLTGTCSLANTTVTASAENNVVVRNNAGVLTGFTVTGSTFSNNSAIGNDGMLFDATGTADITASVSGSTFSSNRDDHFQAAAANTARLNITFTGNTLAGGHATALGQGITINAATAVPGFGGNVRYNISNNSVNGAILNAIEVNLGTSAAAAVMNGTIANNQIGTVGIVRSGSTTGSGIGVDAHGNGTHTLAITGNTIRQTFDRGINVLANDGSGTLNMTVTGNNSSHSDGTNSREGFFLNNGSADPNIFGVADAHFVCLSLGGAGALRNTLTHGPGAPDDFRLRQRFNSTVRLPGYAGAAGDTAAVVTFVNGNNISTTGSATVNTPPGGGFVGGAACPLP